LLYLDEENDPDILTEIPPIETSPVNDHEQLDDLEPGITFSIYGEGNY